VVRVAVLVAYRSLNKAIGTTSDLVFLWTLPETPEPGMRIVLPGGDGLEKFGVVIRSATQADLDDSRPSAPEYSVIRLATPEELGAAKEQREQFWAQARIAAGIESGRHIGVVDFPELYPRDGAATPTEITTYMTGWRRVWKRAENDHRPANETRAYEAVACHWTCLYRQGSKP
jgi:hypothetical protein